MVKLYFKGDEGIFIIWLLKKWKFSKRFSDSIEKNPKKGGTEANIMPESLKIQQPNSGENQKRPQA